MKNLRAIARNFWINYLRNSSERKRNFFKPYKSADKPTISLDLGCGKSIKNPFMADSSLGVDVQYGLDDNTDFIKYCDLGVDELPFEDNTFDYVKAFDVLEHIPRLIYVADQRRQPFIFVMSEIYRVLKPGGIFYSDTPTFPFAEAFIDPTHVNILTSETLPKYFCRPYTWASRYGFFGNYSFLKATWVGPNLCTFLKK